MSDPAVEPPADPEEPTAQGGAEADDAGIEVGVELDGRRYPSTLGGLFYLLVLAGVAIGIAVVTWGEWRTGVRWIGGSMIAAALVRLVLPYRDAGMLAVRHRFVDAVLLGGVGAAFFFLASTIPNQHL